MTDFSNICDILGELYSNYKEDTEFSEFIEYNDLGLPLAYFIKEELAVATDEGIESIQQTWKEFLELIGAEDKGFTDLDSLLDSAE
jgi:hypothetical protein